MIRKAADFPVFKGGHNSSKTSILNTARNLIVKLKGGIRKKRSNGINDSVLQTKLSLDLFLFKVQIF